jgi:SAM-dependent methyltransferase
MRVVLRAAQRSFPRAYSRIRGGAALLEWTLRRTLGRAESDAYDPAFYQAHEEGDWHGLARLILAYTGARRIVDVGCGDGSLLAALLRADPGLELLGLEGSRHGVARTRARGVAAEHCDLAVRGAGVDRVVDFAPDLAISLEVAEHLPPWRAADLVALLSRAPWVVFSAARPNQGGVLHLNERPAGYWIRRFERSGMRLDPRDQAFRGEVSELALAPWYRENVHLLARAGG